MKPKARITVNEAITEIGSVRPVITRQVDVLALQRGHHLGQGEVRARLYLVVAAWGGSPGAFTDSGGR